MDGGVQGLHAPVEALWEARNLADIGNRDPRVADHLRGGAGGDDAHPRFVQPLGQLIQSCLIKHANESAFDGNFVGIIFGHATSLPREPSLSIDVRLS